MRVMSKLRNMFSTRKCMQIAPETEMMHELTPEELHDYSNAVDWIDVCKLPEEE